jgi:SAM-dependent methyltransferase
MCTIGYKKKLNLLFKNRDKNEPTAEVAVVKSDLLAIKTEGSNYYSLGINKRGCAFVSAAVNTPAWTALALEGRKEDAGRQYQKENAGLSNPVVDVSNFLHDAMNVEDWLEKILNTGNEYMGYNLLLADKEKAVHVELYRNSYHFSWIEDMAVVTNHFQHLDHGPRDTGDYPSSFERLTTGNEAISNFISLEDVFNTLKPHNGGRHSFWRTGSFFTVSSAVLDMDSSAIYYSPSPHGEYSRISSSIPPKGAEKVAIEMSRYIDLPTYHKIERAHPFYVEMLTEVNNQIREYYKDRRGQNGRLRVLELGSGTGLCTLELIKNGFLDLDCLEFDKACCGILSSHPESSRYNVIQGDAVTYRNNEKYDLVVSTFAHDHIHYNQRFALAANIFDNLKEGGRYLMGGEVLPYFSNDMERKRSLFLYHNYIINLALQEGRVQLSELENNALKSGLDMVGDFKRHEAMFEKEMESAGFSLVEKMKMGPLDREDVGGVFVYVHER